MNQLRSNGHIDIAKGLVIVKAQLICEDGLRINKSFHSFVPAMIDWIVSVVGRQAAEYS